MATPTANARVQDLIGRIDGVIDTMRDDAGRCRGVKKVLEDVLASGHEFLEPRFLQPRPDRYARRLVHRDPRGRYTVIAMVWDTGQHTPLHDHAGIWCVEVVCRGRIQVTSYRITGGDPEKDLVQFQRESIIHAGVGEAGALIPPFEYHMIENPDAAPAITLHVYGGDMDHCHAFVPVDGGWLREYRELTYAE
ncbi:MAG TPA: cysteine dioxygenase family protein [Vicinamibacterales bacterium]|nr:cysteine dioxygenase family protein [Vicinamibacterales bacterium]